MLAQLFFCTFAQQHRNFRKTFAKVPDGATVQVSHLDDRRRKQRLCSPARVAVRRAPSPLLSITVTYNDARRAAPSPSPASTMTTPLSTQPHWPTPSRSGAGTMLHKAGASVAHLHARRVATPVDNAARLLRVLVLVHRRHGSALGHAMRQGQHGDLAFRCWVVPFPKGG